MAGYFLSKNGLVACIGCCCCCYGRRNIDILVQKFYSADGICNE
jgi:hypothetical protein